MAQIKAAELPVQDSAKPVVIGLYGLPGCGKTTRLRALQNEAWLEKELYACIEGSDFIAIHTPGGLPAFAKLPEVEKREIRSRAIEAIARTSAAASQTAIVTGHFMFWDQEDDSGFEVWTDKDAEIYTHILYLKVPANVIHDRRATDVNRVRPNVSVTRLLEWQRREIDRLVDTCLKHGILFTVVEPDSCIIAPLVQDFRRHNEDYNRKLLLAKLDKVFENKKEVDTIFVFDADRTLSPQDAGGLFWEKYDGPSPALDRVFDSLGYSYKGFRQAALLYEETNMKYDNVCLTAARAIKMYPEIISFLRLVLQQNTVSAVVFTSGLSSVWKAVLEQEGFGSEITVIGGGCIRDGVVVSGDDKGCLVEHLQAEHGKYVWAFGDSPLDIPMLRQADRAVVVVGDEATRSRSMETALQHDVANGLIAQQVLLPAHVSPRLDPASLPIFHFSDIDLYRSLTHGRRTELTFKHRFHDAIRSEAAELLMTPMRNANVTGVNLQKSHKRAGWYLGLTYVANIIGLETFGIRHVQGRNINGHRLADEQETIIAALMRGGEPMAQGLHGAFPLAIFVHVTAPDDIVKELLAKAKTLVLVDSVVNTGNSISAVVRYVRALQPTLRIVIVAGVVQETALWQGELAQAFTSDNKIHLVTLRVSENKYTGTKAVDTGNRLFNTTELA